MTKNIGLLVLLAIFLVLLVKTEVLGQIGVTVNVAEKMNIGKNFGLPNGTRRQYTMDSTFFGLSMEFHDIMDYFDQSTQTPRPWFKQLLLNIKQYTGNDLIIRIGGSTGDRSWYNPKNDPKPNYIWYDVNYSWIQSINALADEVGAKFIIQLSFGSADPIQVHAVEFIQAIGGGLGWNKVFGIEVGNEPDLYAGSYRPLNYTFDQYKIEQASYITEVNQGDPNMPYFYFGGSVCCSWFQTGLVPNLIATMTNVYRAGVEVHLYPLNACGPHPTLEELLSESSITILTQYQVIKDIAKAADEYNTKWALGETNSVICLGEPGTSDTFGAAVWAVDWMLSAGSMGAAGLRFHMTDTSTYSPWIVDTTDLNAKPTILPMYYALLMCSYIVRGGATLLDVSISNGLPGIKVWAVIDNEDATLRIVLLNKNINIANSQAFSITVPQVGITHQNYGEIVSMKAPSMSEKSNIQFAGLSFDGTSDGHPTSGSFTSTKIEAANGKVFNVNLEPYSALVLSISPITPIDNPEPTQSQSVPTNNCVCPENMACCNGVQCYETQNYICSNNLVCPTGYISCGTACYFPTQFTCVNGLLIPSI